MEISNNRALVKENEEALQQLILMMLNDDFVVVSQACSALGRYLDQQKELDVF